MADDERQMAFSPALAEGVHVRGAHTAVADCDFDVVVLERLGCEFDDLQVSPPLAILREAQRPLSFSKCR